MKSNVTLKSNIYINKSARSDDIAFLQHIRDYRILKRKRDNANGLMSSNASWMVPVQEEILRQGQPNCTYEKGTMSWGVPVGGDHMHCRCEQYDCHHYRECSSYAEDILDTFIELWHQAAVEHGSHLQYQLLNKSENDTDALLIPAERSENAAFPPTMNSMRNVDTQSGVFLKRRR